MLESAVPPHVAFILVTYKQEAVVQDAVNAALAQDYPLLEVIVSDDCSPDRTFEIATELVDAYSGPHSVRLSRNQANLGIVGNIMAALALTTADFIVVAAGDDVSMPYRTSRLVEAWQSAGGGTALVYSDYIGIDERSNPISTPGEVVFSGLHTLLDHARGDVRVPGATSAFTKDIVQLFPPLANDVIHEDRVLPFRALLLGGRVIFLHQLLVQYRVDGGVSRNLPKSWHEHALEFAPRSAARILPDAIQRLRDVTLMRPHDIVLRRQCEATIADHQARLAMYLAPPFWLELTFLRGLLAGARVWPLGKHYLKIRAAGLRWLTLK